MLNAVKNCPNETYTFVISISELLKLNKIKRSAMNLAL